METDPTTLPRDSQPKWNSPWDDQGQSTYSSLSHNTTLHRIENPGIPLEKLPLEPKLICHNTPQIRLPCIPGEVMTCPILAKLPSKTRFFVPHYSYLETHSNEPNRFVPFSHSSELVLRLPNPTLLAPAQEFI